MNQYTILSVDPDLGKITALFEYKDISSSSDVFVTDITDTKTIMEKFDNLYLDFKSDQDKKIEVNIQMQPLVGVIRTLEEINT